MNKILFVNACVKPCSRAMKLAEAVLKKIEGNIEEVLLYANPLPVMDLSQMEERERAMQEKDWMNPMFALARQFAAADVIVIAAPQADMMFPAMLKIYLENITVSGITFSRDEKGKTEKLCRANSLYYVTSFDGVAGQNDFGFSYIEALAQDVFGISDVRRVTEEVDFQETEDQTIPYPEKYKNHLALDGASSFSGLIDHKQSRYYVANDFFHMESDETLHILSHFKTYQQTTEYTCGAASSLMVLNWFGEEQYHEKVIAGLLETHNTRGSAVENIADLFDLIGWNVEYHADTERKFQTIEDAENAIVDFIDRGIPIMIDWVDWAGHWAVLIGIDTCGTDTPYDDVLIFADPYDVTDHRQDGYYTYPLGRFFGMWREGPCAEKRVPYQQPFVAAWPRKE